MINQTIPTTGATEGVPGYYTVTAYYDGSDEITDGYLLAVNYDYGGDSSVLNERMLHVEKPNAGNVDYIFGFVARGQGAKQGPCTLKVTPLSMGFGEVYCGASCTLDTTLLFAQIDSYEAGVCGPVCIGTAAQTVDRSSTSGLVQAHLRVPTPTLRLDNQEIGGSAHFTDAIWKNFPLDLLRNHPHLGSFVEYDPAHSPAHFPSYSEFQDSNASIELVEMTTLAEGRQFVLGQGATAENNAAEVQIPCKIDINGKPWAFEVEYDVVDVGDDEATTFVGLWEADTLDGDMLVDTTQATDDKNLIGFQIKNDDGNAIDAIYKADGQTQVDKVEGVGVPTANTAIRVAMYYNGSTITIYVDGSADATTITAANIAAATFPSDADMYPTFINKGGGSADDGDDLNIRALRFAQLA